MNLAMVAEAATKTAVAVAGTAAVSYIDISIPYIGVPLNVVVAAIGGTIAGFAWSEKVEARKKVFGIAFACVISACAMTWIAGMLARHFWGIKVDTRDLAPLAIIFALFGRQWIPAVQSHVDPWLSSIPFINKASPPVSLPQAPTVPKEGE
jgi:hypothetical protein